MHKGVMHLDTPRYIKSVPKTLKLDYIYFFFFLPLITIAVVKTSSYKCVTMGPNVFLDKTHLLLVVWLVWFDMRRWIG